MQGVGKTTACGKLALLLKKQKKSVLMVATDVYRPAAIDQLQKLGKVGGPSWNARAGSSSDDIHSAELDLNKQVPVPK